MSLSPSFSDFPNGSGTQASFMAGSGFAHARATATSMSLLPAIPAAESTSNSTTPNGNTATSSPRQSVVERRATPVARAGRSGVERRQFGSSYAELSDDGRDLAAAIDHYKLQHHRRYITCDEMLLVLESLGYRKSPLES